MMRPLFCQPLRAGLTLCLLVVALAVVLTPSPAVAQQPTNFGSASGVTCPGGNVICNGSINFLTTELFFEPETPPQSLKEAPTTWNEIEQLLDNPYAYTWGAACNDAAGTVPGNEQGYPTYCTTNSSAANNPGTFFRRPNAVDPATGRFNVSTLRPLLLHPLNYNPQTGFGAQMRILNPNYGGGAFDATSVCYNVGGPCNPKPNMIDVTSGGDRGLETGTAAAPAETVIDMNVSIGRAFPFCQTNPEPIPIAGGFPSGFLTSGTSQGTAFDSENLTACGSDPGEPGAASLAHANTNAALCITEVLGAGSLAGILCEDNIGLPRVGQNTSSWYSIPAVAAPNLITAALMQVPNGGLTTNDPTGVAPIGTGVVLNPAAGFRLRDPARGGVIQALNVATGVGGMHKPSLRKAEVGGNGTTPNYLWNSAAAANQDRLDPTGGDLVPSNENDYVGLFGAGTLQQRKQQARLEAMVLGKALFWDQQVGSDGVQACGSCHAHAAADNRTKNQINPNGQDGLRGEPTNFAGAPNTVFDPIQPNVDLKATDFPFLKLNDPDIAGDPLCKDPIVANVAGFTFPEGDPLDNPKIPSTFTVCDAGNRTAPDTEEVASSMGVHFGRFWDIPDGTGAGLNGGSFGPASHGVRALIHDKRSPVAADNINPIPGFAGSGGPTGANEFRRVEPRNTPTIFLADMNFDNFWDGRARHDDNGGSVFGASDPQAHIWVNQIGTLVPTRQLIKFSSLGSLAKGPALSKFEMSFDGRNWAKIGKKLLQAGVTPLANQLVESTDSILGRYSNQGGSACTAANIVAADRSGSWVGNSPALAAGKPGLCISYRGLIRHAFYPALHNNTTQHFNGCYTDGFAGDGQPLNPANLALHPNQCGTGGNPAASIEVLDPDGVVRAHNNDPFDQFVLNLAGGAASATDTNQFTQMEANFSLFWGQSIHIWATILVPDDTPDDKFLDANPDVGASMGETGEPLLVLDLPNCPNPQNYHRGYFLGDDGFRQYRGSCFQEVGNFKRDDDLTDTTTGTTLPAFTTESGHRNYIGGACVNETTVAGTRLCTQRVAAAGTRHHGSNEPNPLLGFDIFFGANASLKNPNYRSARCGACHNAPALTDHTSPFTVKATELDNFGEFERGAPTVEPLTEPAVRERLISGFLLESEINEPGQDAIERKAGNLGIVPAPVVANGNCTTANCSGYVYPDAITINDAMTGYIIHQDLGSGPVAGPGDPVPFTSFAGSFIDNGVYNIGVRPCVADQTHVIGACEDTGRGNTDAFGWPLSFAALMMKAFGGPAQEPGTPIAQFNPNNKGAREAGLTNVDVQDCAPFCATGGLVQLTAQDQRINPGYEDEYADPQVPAFMAPFLNRITVGDEHPQSDEACGPVGACINTLMDVANEEGFPEVPMDPRGSAGEVTNGASGGGDGDSNLTGSGCTTGGGSAPCSAGVDTPVSVHGSAEMGTWPVVNRVGRFGNFKAPQLREVELTGPYFHNGGKLTLRQVVDFYVRGGDFPVTNSQHRDFNILNLNAELQSDLTEEDKVALVDYMLEFTDDRVALEAAPFDHPQLILPLDGTAPESDGTINRDAMLTGCAAAPAQFGPGQQFCGGDASAIAAAPTATGPLFLNVPATGATGNPGGRIPNFLGIAGAVPDAANPGGRQRLVGPAAFCGDNITSQYCH